LAIPDSLAALKSAFDQARNPQVPASAGKGLPSFGPTLVPQLTGALGVMSTFAQSTGAGVVGPAAVAVATSIYDSYLKTSIATGVGFSTGSAGFSDRSLYDVGDWTSSGFHAAVSGTAIEQAVACGQASPACATVEDSLLAPVIHTGLGTSAAISVTQTPAQFSAGTEPDLASIEAPGQQVTQLVSAVQQVDPTTFTNPAVQQLTGNYSAAFTKLITDINAHHAAFPANATGAAGGYGTPSSQSWDGYNAFAGTDQPVPAGDDKNPAPTALPNCANSNTVGLSGPMTWESAANLPNSYFLLDNLAGFSNGAVQPLTDPLCYTFSAVTSDEVCRTVKGVTTCTFTVTDSGSLEVRFEGTDGNVHVLKTYTLPPASFDCSDQMVCPFFTEAGFIANRIVHQGNGSVAQLLSSITPTTTSLDVLASEGASILAAEQKQNFQWDIDGLTNPNTPDHATLNTDSENLTGAFELLQLLAQTVAPSASLGNQALSDILYGQDQLPTIPTGPNNPVAILQGLRDGTGTAQLSDYATLQQGRVTELANLLNAILGSAQQSAGGLSEPGRAPSPSTGRWDPAASG
jgi:hypothetical protein